VRELGLGRGVEALSLSLEVTDMSCRDGRWEQVVETESQLANVLKNDLSRS